MAIINMQTMRYINLLDRASKVKTSKCFIYNNTIIFAVQRDLVSRAIGPGASNIRMIQEKLGKRIRIIGDSTGLDDLPRFIGEIVYPARFKSLDIKDKEIILTAGSAQNKATLLGRNKKRFDELKTIVYGTYGFDLKIV